MSNISLKVFWNNNPIPVDQRVSNPDIILNIPFGAMIPNPSQSGGSVESVNGKSGVVVLDYSDVGADQQGAAAGAIDYLEPKITEVQTNIQDQLADVQTLLESEIDNLADTKLDKVDYVQHFRGVFSSYVALTEALPTASDGDYAHIDSGSGFDRMVAVWDSSDSKWVVNEVGVVSNTDEVAEGSTNLYFTSQRVRNTPLSGLATQPATPITATDQILQAFAKLQAQISNPPAKQITWVDIKTLPNTAYLKALSTSNIEFANIDGYAWVRGTLITNGGTNNDFLVSIGSLDYRVRDGDYGYMKLKISTIDSPTFLEIVFSGVTIFNTKSTRINCIGTIPTGQFYIHPTCLGKIPI